MSALMSSSLPNQRRADIVRRGAGFFQFGRRQLRVRVEPDESPAFGVTDVGQMRKQFH